MTKPRRLGYYYLRMCGKTARLAMMKKKRKKKKSPCVNVRLKPLKIEMMSMQDLLDLKGMTRRWKIE